MRRWWGKSPNTSFDTVCMYKRKASKLPRCVGESETAINICHRIRLSTAHIVPLKSMSLSGTDSNIVTNYRYWIFMYIYTRVALYNLTSYRRGNVRNDRDFAACFVIFLFGPFELEWKTQNISGWLIAEQIFFGVSTGWKNTPTRKVDNASSTRWRCAISAWQFHTVLQLLMISYFLCFLKSFSVTHLFDSYFN